MHVKSLSAFQARFRFRCSQARNRDCPSGKARRIENRIEAAHVRSPLVSTLNTWDHGQTRTATGVDGDFPEKSRAKTNGIGRISPRNPPRIRAPNQSIEPCHHPGQPLSASPKRIRASVVSTNRAHASNSRPRAARELPRPLTLPEFCASSIASFAAWPSGGPIRPDLHESAGATAIPAHPRFPAHRRTR